MTTASDPWVSMNSRVANARAEAALGFWSPRAEAAAETAEPEPDAEPGHEYDGPELHPGTPEYAAEYREYEVWAGRPGPENEPVPHMLTPQADGALEAADPEPEAEPELEAEP
jgi:hypothetical protein